MTKDQLQRETNDFMQQRLWRVVRFVREEYQVEAATRQEALDAAQDPHSIMITRETCVPERPNSVLPGKNA